MAPVSAEDVNKVVINAVGSNFQVVNYSLEPFSVNTDGVLGCHSLLTIKVKAMQNSASDCELKTLTFFVKSLPESDLIQGLMANEAFKEEINFYKNIQPLMLSDYVGERWSPKCYLAEKALVFEDLRAQDFSMNSETIMSVKILKSAIASLARFHASSLFAEAKLGKPLDKAFPEYFSEKIFDESTKFGQGTVLGFKTIVLMADKLNLDASFVIPHMYNHVHKIVRPQKGELNVLCHNDLWKNNILFDKKIVPECVIVDYQVMRYATPIADLSMLLYLNTTPEFRKELEIEMVDHYYSIFQENLQQNNILREIPSHEDFSSSYKKYRLIGMTMAAMYLPAIYLEPERFQNLVSDPKAIERYMLHDRMDIIGPSLNSDPTYVKKMKDLLNEVLNEGKRVINV